MLTTSQPLGATGGMNLKQKELGHALGGQVKRAAKSSVPLAANSAGAAPLA